MNRTKRATVQYGVQPHHIWWVLGLLIARERRPMTLGDLAQLIGISRRGLNYIIEGKYTGGVQTLNAFLSLRETKGLMIHRSDFEISSQESQQSFGRFLPSRSSP